MPLRLILDEQRGGAAGRGEGRRRTSRRRGTPPEDFQSRWSPGSKGILLLFRKNHGSELIHVLNSENKECTVSDSRLLRMQLGEYIDEYIRGKHPHKKYYREITHRTHPPAAPSAGARPPAQGGARGWRWWREFSPSAMGFTVILWSTFRFSEKFFK